MSKQGITVLGQPKATMSLRVKRAGSDEWQDGPEVNAVETNLPFLMRLKLVVYTRLLKGLTRLQSKLEEMQK